MSFCCDSFTVLHQCLFRWVFHTAKELGGSPQNGRLAAYDGGGYVQDLIGGNSSALVTISELRDGGWLDRSTRAVFIDFSLYNANVNLFCIVRFWALLLFLVTFILVDCFIFNCCLTIEQNQICLKKTDLMLFTYTLSKLRTGQILVSLILL